MTKNYLLLGFQIILFGNLHSQITTTLSASKDAAIGYHDGAGTAGNNYGYASQNAAYCIPAVADPSGVNVNRALIDFNLSVIPQGATIISAYINLYALGAFGSLPGHTGNVNACYLQRITQNWQENTVTWNNQPTSSTLNQVTLNQSASAAQDYLNLNVTGLVQDMLTNSSSSYGFLLKLINQASTNCLAFASKDHSDPTKAPKLVITYSVGCATSKTLTADYDAAIGYHDGASTAGNNYGTAQQNAAYAIPSVAAPSGLNVNRALIHFDFSTIPANAVITSAQLDLFAFGPVGSWSGHTGTANNAYIERITSSWTESGVTWNNQPTTSSVNQLLLPGTINANLDYLSINVQPIIQDILSSQNNYGIKLRLQAENATNILIFCSEDHPDPSKHPVLRITYTCPEIVSFGSTNNVSNLDFSLFPNPSTGRIHINQPFQNSISVVLNVLDAQGKMVSSHLIDPSAPDTIIDDLNLENGIYSCILIVDQKPIINKKLVIMK